MATKKDKTAAERAARFDKNQHDRGLVRVRPWVPQAYADDLKAVARALCATGKHPDDARSALRVAVAYLAEPRG